MFQTKVVEKIRTQITCSVSFSFFKYRIVYEIMWKNISRAGQAADNNMANALCLLDA
jgi:preprotein translocase subunit SecG